MCLSASPTQFSKTITGTWEVLIDGVINHVLWYQNRVGTGTAHSPRSLVLEIITREVLKGHKAWVQTFEGHMAVNNISVHDVLVAVHKRSKELGIASPVISDGEDFEAPVKEAETFPGNALIIPLLGAWSSIRLLNTSSTSNLLEDIDIAVRGPIVPGASAERYGGFAGSVAFIKFGIYDIVLAEDALDLTEALKQIQPEKRPVINEDLFRTFKSWYDCPLALCCFNNAMTGQSMPLAFAFEPYNAHELSVYTLDGHDGRSPNPYRKAYLDHSIFVGSYLMNQTGGTKVTYKEQIPDHLRPYVLDRIMGLQLRGDMENGDFIFKTEAVRNGHFEGFRTLPPRAPHDIPKRTTVIRRAEDYVLTG